jgi:hypothetical protein
MLQLGINNAVIMTNNFSILQKPTGWVPATQLDQVLIKAGLNGAVTRFINILDGSVITEDNKGEFFRRIVTEREAGIYTTIDHLIIWVQYKGVNFLYVSLDNSVRANQNGFPCKDRLVTIGDLVNQAILTAGGSVIVFFSEACRPSFDGGMDVRANPMSWLAMRRFICVHCNLTFVTELANNQDIGNMAFGIACFCTPDMVSRINGYYSHSILDLGFGSVAVGIEVFGDDGNKYIGWGIHFPLDFRGRSEENQGAITMVNLQALMDRYPESAFAMGDFNTIPGYIEDAILAAIHLGWSFVIHGMLTFFGAHYDLVPGEAPELLIKDF